VNKKFPVLSAGGKLGCFESVFQLKKVSFGKISTQNIKNEFLYFISAILKSIKMSNLATEIRSGRSLRCTKVKFSIFSLFFLTQDGVIVAINAPTRTCTKGSTSL